MQGSQVQIKKAEVVENAQEQPEQPAQKKKIELFTLGEQPFLFADNQQQDFISCRLGNIKQNALASQKIKSLCLRNNLIAEIKGLDQMPNLEELELYDNRIVEIKNLDNLPNLLVLDLSYNNIKKIQNLNKLPKLKKLFLLSNKIKKVCLLTIKDIKSIIQLA